MKICSAEKITDNRHLNLISVKYKDRNATEKNWIYATRGNRTRPDAVVIVPYHRTEKKLVLIKEFRVPLGETQYGFPAGLVDPGESIDQAGRRELLEETGLTVTRVLKISPPIFSSSGMTDESISLLYAECEGEPSTADNEASEEIEVILVSKAGAGELLNRSDYNFDVKSWIVLDQFAVSGRIVPEG
ncbi:MAG: NUDIX hydrolase [Desulfobacterales bacterium]|nr:NUDIX hydrolase [Desulfobacterales bacterium]